MKKTFHTLLLISLITGTITPVHAENQPKKSPAAIAWKLTKIAGYSAEVMLPFVMALAGSIRFNSRNLVTHWNESYINWSETKDFDCRLKRALAHPFQNFDLDLQVDWYTESTCNIIENASFIALCLLPIGHGLHGLHKELTPSIKAIYNKLKPAIKEQPSLKKLQERVKRFSSAFKHALNEGLK